MTKVAVVILNYNTADLLTQLLPSVVNSSYPDLEIIVADNGSTDYSRQAVEAFPSVSWMDLGKNYGYAEGYNRALENLDANYAVLLNSDVEVTPNWVEPLVDFIENNPEYAALQPKIKSYHAKDYFEYAGASGGFMDYLGYPFCRGRIFDELEQDTGQYDEPTDIFWASGAALFISLEAFRTAGGLDKKLFAHMEEIDLAWRIQLMGKKIACIPASEVYHIGGGTLSHQSAKKTYLNFRNSLVLLARYNKGFTRITKVGLRLILDFPAALLFLSKGRINDVFAIIKAHWHFLLRISYWAKPLSFPNKNTKPAGYLPKSIVYLHYLKKVKTFDKLKSFF
jgi:GT2 family glycosyltransferase